MYKNMLFDMTLVYESYGIDGVGNEGVDWAGLKESMVLCHVQGTNFNS